MVGSDSSRTQFEQIIFKLFSEKSENFCFKIKEDAYNSAIML
jgi:hypothetical protein